MSQFWVPWSTCWVRMPPPSATSRSLRPWTSKSTVSENFGNTLVCVQTRSRLHVPGRGDASVAEKRGTLVQCSLPQEQLHMQQPVCCKKLLGEYKIVMIYDLNKIYLRQTKVVLDETMLMFQIYWISPSVHSNPHLTDYKRRRTSWVGDSGHQAPPWSVARSESAQTSPLSLQNQIYTSLYLVIITIFVVKKWGLSAIKTICNKYVLVWVLTKEFSLFMQCSFPKAS